ncbi:hypothetical protein [Nonomuraea sp. NPDC048826]|uniref:hypothetical protein n=1 Tax=Nonomuraea sp. NPDC048826 TaxID=3364347 RepID=UPI00371DA808
MKRVIAALAGPVALMAAALLTAAPAHASAPADPVKVLQKRLAKGTGLKFTDATSYIDMSGKTTFLRRSGKLLLDKKGVAAADLSASYTDHQGSVFNSLSHQLGEERVIYVGKKVYLKSDRWTLKGGKTWMGLRRTPFFGMTGSYAQTINAAEPATLKALISSGKKSGRTYTGKISESKLWKISPWFRLNTLVAPKKPATLEYRLTLGANNLPQKLVATHLASEHWVESLVGDDKISVETRYTGWGSKVRITAPPKSQVAEAKG